MQIAGIIAEYDPFHKGHAAHISATRQDGATHIVAVISGSFTQRGEPAMLSKFTRAEMVLAAGADLVLESPVLWSMAPAQRFAEGGVGILHALGCVDSLSFGSECGDANILKSLADIADSEDYSKSLKTALSTGMPYAAARQVAAAHLVGEKHAAHLSAPNNTLAVEYIRAAAKYGADWRMFTLSRQGALHTDMRPQDGYASGTALRDLVRKQETATTAAYMPAETHTLLKRAVAEGDVAVCEERLAAGILARLRLMSAEELATLPYLSEGLENRLYRAIQTATSVEELLTEAKTKRYPHSRLRRILWCAMLGLTAADLVDFPPYIRVLGMNSRGQEILAAASPTLPVISRYAQIEELDEAARRVVLAEGHATDLRALMLTTPKPCGEDWIQKFIIK